MTAPTVADTAVQVRAWALLLVLMRIRIADLEDQLAGARQSAEETADEFAGYRLTHPDRRPEVRRG